MMLPLRKRTTATLPALGVILLTLLLAACEPPANVREQGPVSVPVPLPEGQPLVITDLPPEDRGPLTGPANVPLPPEADVLTSGQVLDRLRARLSQPACIVGPNNTRWRHKYAGYPQHFADQIQAILPRMLVVMDALEAHHLPAEFATVPIVESWYRLDVRSFGGAAGMWQFLAQTARNNGAVVSGDYDGRLLMLDSTDAAMGYLGMLDSMFNDWRLVGMAYNSGEFRLAKTMSPAELAARGAGSIVRYRRPGGLAWGTYEYVSKMRALICLLDQPVRQNIPLDPTIPVIHWVRFTIPAGIDSLDELAARLGTDADALKTFNGFRSSRIPADSPRMLYVPASTRPRWTSVTAEAATPGSTPPPAPQPATPPSVAPQLPAPSAAIPPSADSRPASPQPASKPQAESPPAASRQTQPNPAVPNAVEPERTARSTTAVSSPATAHASPSTAPRPAHAGTRAADSAPVKVTPVPTGAIQPATGTSQTVLQAPATPPAAGSAKPATDSHSGVTEPSGHAAPSPVGSPPVPTTPTQVEHPSSSQPAGSFHPPVENGSKAIQPPPASAPSPALPARPDAGSPTRSPTAPPDKGATTATAPSTRPPATAPTMATTAPPHTPRTYKVQLDDSLQSIATQFGVKVEDLRAWNHLSIDATLYVDEVLKLEP